MAADYKAMGAGAAARKHGVGPSVLYNAMISHGLFQPRNPRWEKEDILALHAEYQAGASLTKLAAKYGRSRKGISDAFARRGLPMRTPPKRPRLANGCIAPFVPKTDAEIEELIQKATKIKVPQALTKDWRRWPLWRRAGFIGRLRARLKSAEDRPETPFSSNVEPFDYFSPKARAIAAKLNQGRNSQTKRVAMRPSSQGVIWRGELFFWSHQVGYTHWGGWNRATEGRPSLHHIIWEEATGREVPAGHVVRFADGNKNNLDPSNLVLATRDSVARENQATALTRKSREKTATLLNLSTRKKTTHDHATTLRSIETRRKRPARLRPR